ncbi:Hypothetical predicted protein [Paramuricea clavata]|uniref:Uncharacterized protein n=1 Tax=Paramuricea clavata TaxID=317549 RepID=A0A7D9E4R2_PARCT|nr:Hypothetical predicted protein [Paramuricea clavata]
MADKTEQTQVPVTSEKKKDPRRVAAGKRLAAISKIAKERKKKQAESDESSSGSSMITYVGIAIAFITLVITFRMNQREEKALELKYTPPTMSTESKMSKEVYDAVLLTAGAVGISMASKKILKEPLGTPENVKGMLKLAVSEQDTYLRCLTRTDTLRKPKDITWLWRPSQLKREKYLEEVTDRRNKIAQLREELAEANSDIKSTNQSLELVRKIGELTHNPDRAILRNQFQKVVRCIQRLRLQRGRNIVRYKVYLLRLASMNRIEFRNPPEDIRTAKIVNALEDRLYGKVFVELGWKPEGCRYYNRWMERTGGNITEA